MSVALRRQRSDVRIVLGAPANRHPVAGMTCREASLQSKMSSNSLPPHAAQTCVAAPAHNMSQAAPSAAA